MNITINPMHWSVDEPKYSTYELAIFIKLESIPGNLQTDFK